MPTLHVFIFYSLLGYSRSWQHSPLAVFSRMGASATLALLPPFFYFYFSQSSCTKTFVSTFAFRNLHLHFTRFSCTQALRQHSLFRPRSRVSSALARSLFSSATRYKHPCCISHTPSQPASSGPIPQHELRFTNSFTEPSLQESESIMGTEPFPKSWTTASFTTFKLRTVHTTVHKMDSHASLKTRLWLNRPRIFTRLSYQALAKSPVQRTMTQNPTQDG